MIKDDVYDAAKQLRTAAAFNPYLKSILQRCSSYYDQDEDQKFDSRIYPATMFMDHVTFAHFAYLFDDVYHGSVLEFASDEDVQYWYAQYNEQLFLEAQKPLFIDDNELTVLTSAILGLNVPVYAIEIVLDIALRQLFRSRNN